MWPVIANIGPFTLYSFGVVLVLSIVVGMFTAWKKIHEYHIEDEEFFDASLQVIFWGLVGSRVVYIVEHFSDFGINPLKWLWFTHYVGLSMWGAIVGGVLAMVWLVRVAKRDIFEWFDIFSLGLLAGLVIGRLASWLNGSSNGIKGLPVQLGESALMLILFSILWNLEGSYRTIEWYRGGKSSAKAGFLLFSSLVGLGVIFLTTSFLYSNSRILDKVWPVISLLTGIVGLYWRSGRSLASDFKIKLPKRQ